MFLNNSSLRYDNTTSTYSRCFSFSRFYSSSVATLVINGLLSPVAVCLNALIAVLILKQPSLRNPSNLMIVGLASVDLATGLMQPTFVASQVALQFCSGKRMVFHQVLLSLMILCSGSAFAIIAGVSLEMALALHFHLRYHSIITTTHVVVFLVGTWLSCATLVLLDRIIPKTNIVNYSALFIVTILFAITVVSHVQIFRTVRRHKRQISSQKPSVLRVDGSRETKLKRNGPRDKRMDIDGPQMDIDGPQISRMDIDGSQVSRMNNSQTTRVDTNSSRAKRMNNSSRVAHILRETKRAINLAMIIALHLLFYSPHFALQLLRWFSLVSRNQIQGAYLWTETALFLRSSINPLVWFWKKSELKLALMHTWNKHCNNFIRSRNKK